MRASRLPSTRPTALLALATLALTAQADASPPDAPPRVAEVAHALRAVAVGEASVSAALGPLVALPPDAATAPQDLRLPGFVDADGHVVEELDLRIRQGVGVDNAGLIVLRIAGSPCLDIHALARGLGAHEAARYPPSPHVPLPPEGPGGAHGYRLDHAGGSRLEVLADNAAPDCATRVTVRRPYPGLAERPPARAAAASRSSPAPTRPTAPARSSHTGPPRRDRPRPSDH
ncbi:hypothetical protein [Coralloluteibacterium thermophilus]|uniref:Uncharacterized protein n=1 Tax=Coralloluteibacterium thermophilum TaxID=2707049 RepID=A0ABV9NPY1_9GAMM